MISVLGTTHVSVRSGNAVARAIRNGNFQIIFVEGVTPGVLYEDARGEPLLLPWLWLWRIVLKRFGKDFSTVYTEAKKKNIKVVNIDLTLRELVLRWKDLWKWVVALSAFMVFWLLLFRWYLLPRFVIAFILGWFVYFAYFALSTMKLRNTHWVTQIQMNLSQNRNENALLVCGKYHVKDLSGKLRLAGFETVKIS